MMTREEVIEYAESYQPCNECVFNSPTEGCRANGCKIHEFMRTVVELVSVNPMVIVHTDSYQTGYQDGFRDGNINRCKLIKQAMDDAISYYGYYKKDGE